jgi:hypothetical protein
MKVGQEAGGFAASRLNSGVELRLPGVSIHQILLPLRDCRGGRDIGGIPRFAFFEDCRDPDGNKFCVACHTREPKA